MSTISGQIFRKCMGKQGLVYSMRQEFQAVIEATRSSCGNVETHTRTTNPNTIANACLGWKEDACLGWKEEEGRVCNSWFWCFVRVVVRPPAQITCMLRLRRFLLVTMAFVQKSSKSRPMCFCSAKVVRSNDLLFESVRNRLVLYRLVLFVEY